ncbi:hypothetical protein KC324_g29 [Hortaea werneckii]|nr:hypothetical protein KC324_g29 [Hortaea werneckii]
MYKNSAKRKELKNSTSTYRGRHSNRSNASRLHGSAAPAGIAASSDFGFEIGGGGGGGAAAGDSVVERCAADGRWWTGLGACGNVHLVSVFALGRYYCWGPRLHAGIDGSPLALAAASRLLMRLRSEKHQCQHRPPSSTALGCRVFDNMKVHSHEFPCAQFPVSYAMAHSDVPVESLVSEPPEDPEAAEGILLMKLPFVAPPLRKFHYSLVKHLPLALGPNLSAVVSVSVDNILFGFDVS